jgi:streptogramin lyase
MSLCVVLPCCAAQQEKNVPASNTNQTANEPARSSKPIVNTDTTFIPSAPSKISRKIRKDRQGNLLIAAFTDVIVYNGTSFSAIPKPIGVESFDAFDALEDSKGNIWIASTHHGVFRYEGENFTHFTTEDGLAHNRTMHLHEDNNGNIWIATMGGVSCYTGNSFKNFTTKEGLSHNEVNTIVEDKDGNIWFGTQGGVCLYNPMSSSFTDITNISGKSFENVRHIIEDSKGNMWLGGKNGLWQYDGALFTNFSQEFVGYMYEDTQGNIWTTSESSHSQGWVLSVYEHALSSQGKTIAKERKMLFGISEDTNGNIWVGTLQGVFKYDGKSVMYFRDIQ